MTQPRSLLKSFVRRRGAAAAARRKMAGSGYHRQLGNANAAPARPARDAGDGRRPQGARRRRRTVWYARRVIGTPRPSEKGAPRLARSVAEGGADAAAHTQHDQDQEAMVTERPSHERGQGMSSRANMATMPPLTTPPIWSASCRDARDAVVALTPSCDGPPPRPTHRICSPGRRGRPWPSSRRPPPRLRNSRLRRERGDDRGVGQVSGARAKPSARRGKASPRKIGQCLARRRSYWGGCSPRREAGSRLTPTVPRILTAASRLGGARSAKRGEMRRTWATRSPSGCISARRAAPGIGVDLGPVQKRIETS